MQHPMPIFRELLRGSCFQNSNCTEYSNQNPVTRASSRDINAISPDTEIRRRHIEATSADDPTAYSSNCRKRAETACPFGWYRKRCTDALRDGLLAKRWFLKVSYVHLYGHLPNGN